MSSPDRAHPLCPLRTASFAVAVVVLTGPSLAALSEAPLPQGSLSDLPDAPGVRTVATRCLACHGADIVVAQRLSVEGWAREVDKMTGWGAQVEKGERDDIIQYLAGQLGVRSSARRDPAAASLLSRCLVCHDGRLVEQQRLTRDAWTREIDKMRGADLYRFTMQCVLVKQRFFRRARGLGPRLPVVSRPAEADKGPKNPWNAVVGISSAFRRHFEVFAENGFGPGNLTFFAGGLTARF